MNAVLLAAGYGTRLLPLTEETPKILIDVGGETLLNRQLRYLREQGFDRVLVNAHHHADQIVDAVKGNPNVEVFVEDELQGTAGALLPMRDSLESRFVVLNGDTLTDLPLAPLMGRLGAGSDVIVTLAHSDYTAGKGVADVVGGLIVGFREKPEDGNSGFVNQGVYAMNDRALDWIEPGDDLAIDLFPKLAADGRLSPCFTERRFLDVGTPEDLRRAASARW